MPLHRGGRRLGVERHAGALAGALDRRDDGGGIIVGLDVEDDQVATGARESIGVRRAC